MTTIERRSTGMTGLVGGCRTGARREGLRSAAMDEKIDEKNFFFFAVGNRDFGFGLTTSSVSTAYTHRMTSALIWSAVRPNLSIEIVQ